MQKSYLVELHDIDKNFVLPYNVLIQQSWFSMALRGVEATYGKMVNSGKTSFNGKSIETLETSKNEKDTWIFGGTGDANVDAYDAFIAELNVPGNRGITASNININKRKSTFLEPRADFDPSKDFNDEDNVSKLWRDPWGNCYRVYINVEGEKYLTIKNGSKTTNVATDVALYSFGPNGTDDGGCNADLDDCISSGTHKLHDDIVSWSK